MSSLVMHPCAKRAAGSVTAKVLPSACSTPSSAQPTLPPSQRLGPQDQCLTPVQRSGLSELRQGPKPC
jgi:hypothetical protein